MKPEDKQRLKRVCWRKGSRLTTLIGFLGLAFFSGQSLQTKYTILQDLEVLEVLRTIENSLAIIHIKNLDTINTLQSEVVFEISDQFNSINSLTQNTTVFSIKSLKRKTVNQPRENNKTNIFEIKNHEFKKKDNLEISVRGIGIKETVPDVTGILTEKRLEFSFEFDCQLGNKSDIPHLIKNFKDKNSPFRFEAYCFLKRLSKSGQITHLSKTEYYYYLVFDSIVLLITIFMGIVALISFLQIRNPYPLSWSGHLLLPEETIAELIALKRRRQKQNLPQWKLNLELTTEVLLLLWAIHIQVRFQNFRLPPSKKRNID